MRFVIVCIVGVAMIGLLPGQGSAQPDGWNLSLKAGWSGAGFYGGARNSTGQDGRNGFAAGLAAEYQANQRFGFEVGAWFSQKGSSGRIDNNLPNSPSNPPRPPGDVVVGDIRLDYVGFSALATVHGAIADQQELKFFTGPGLNNLVSADFEGTLNGTPLTYDLSDNLTSVDLVIVIGMEYEYRLDRMHLVLDVRGEFGANNIDDRDVDMDFRTRAVFITAGVELPLTAR